jgi:carboxyl-terminal processing protease
MNDALQDDGLQINERNLNRELEIEKIRKNTKDILLNEAANVLSDEINLWTSHTATIIH